MNFAPAMRDCKARICTAGAAACNGAIGVFWGANAASYYYTTATLPTNTSFGSLLSGISLSTTTAPTSMTYTSGSSSIDPQQLTMTP